MRGYQEIENKHMEWQPEKEQVKTRADIARLEAQIAELRAASIRSHENKDILDNAAPPPASG
jgi:DNA repair ATPase RecN